MKPIFLDYRDRDKIVKFGLSDHELEKFFSDVHPFEPKWIEAADFWDKLLEEIERQGDDKSKAFPTKAQWMVSVILKSSINFGKEIQLLNHKKQNIQWIWEGSNSELRIWGSKKLDCKEATQKAYSILNSIVVEFCMQFKTSLIILNIYCWDLSKQKIHWFTIRQPHGRFELRRNHKISSCNDNGILNMLSLYREAINSNSPFYQLLCFYKICHEARNEVFPKLKSRVESRNIHVDLVKPEIPFGQHKGKSFTQFLDDEDVHGYRAKVAHWLTKKNAQLDLNSFNELVHCWEFNVVLNFIVRTTIINCLKLWHVVNKPNEQFGIDPEAKVSTDFSWKQNEAAISLPEETLQTKPSESVIGQIPSVNDKQKMLKVVPLWGKVPFRRS